MPFCLLMAMQLDAVPKLPLSLWQKEHGKQLKFLLSKADYVELKTPFNDKVCPNERACFFKEKLEEFKESRKYAQGKYLHANIIRIPAAVDIPTMNMLIDMYGKCGAMDSAISVFDTMHKRNVFSWTLVLAAYTDMGLCKEAIQAFEYMCTEVVKPNNVTFIVILTACSMHGSLAIGKLVHVLILQNAFDEDIALWNALITMYGKCMSLKYACLVFNRMIQKNVVSWNSMIGAFSAFNCGLDAFQIFQELCIEGPNPNIVTFITILNAFSDPKALGRGNLVHAAILIFRLVSDTGIGNALINMYAKCGNVDEARKVFDSMPQLDVVSWTSMISLYAQHGNNKEPFYLFWQMRFIGIKPNRITFITIIGVCASLRATELGLLVHSLIINARLELDITILTSLVKMYGSCGRLKDAHSMLYRTPMTDLILWTAMLAAYAHCGHWKDTIHLFQTLYHNRVRLNNITFITVLDAFCCPSDLGGGKLVHANVIQHSFEIDTLTSNSLINMYGKCGCIESSWRVFGNMCHPNIISWTSSITSCVQNGCGKDALQLFCKMIAQGINPDKVAVICIFDACASLGAVQMGKLIHAFTFTTELFSDLTVCNAILNMYSQCSDLENARNTFQIMPEKDVMSWTCMVSIYVQWQHNERALLFYDMMCIEGLEPDKVMFLNLVDACTNLSRLIKGTMIHAIIVAKEIETGAVGNAVLNMYGKLGNMEDAWRVFCSMSDKDVVSWTSMISIYSQHGLAVETIQLLHNMRLLGMRLNEVSFIGLISACSNAGLIDEGVYYFISMSGDYNVRVQSKQLGCVALVIGREGLLDEAEDLLSSFMMETEVPHSKTWDLS